MNKQKLVLGSLVLLGFSSLLAQIVLIRELLVIFYGNELSLGLILACWLWWTALGSGWLGRAADKLEQPLKTFLWAQSGLALLLPLTLLGARTLRIFLKIPPGELVGPLPMLYSSLLLLAPLGLSLGFLFTLTCRIYSQINPPADIAIGRSYLAEGIGAGLAGVSFTYLLVNYLMPWQMMLTAATLSLGIALLLAYSEAQTKNVCFITGACIFILLLLANLPFCTAWLENRSLAWRWPNLSLVSSQDSRYGNLSLTRRAEQASLWENGLLMFSYPDLLSAEEAVHFALLEHPDPQEVLLIGGGVGGSLGEILKHPQVRQVDYVELDPLIIELGQQALPPPARKDLEDARVKIHHQDGRFFVKHTSRKYEAVIVNLPEPYTAQLNRFYTGQFFREVKQALKPNGLICLGFSSAENYLSQELAQFLGSIYFSLKQVFPQVIALPGDSNFLLAATQAGMLTTDAGVLVRRLQERKLDTRYVREYYLPFRLSPERVDYLSQRLQQQAGVRLNYDFAPISYYYQLLFWCTYVAPGAKKIFSRLAQLSWEWGLLLPVLLGIFFAQPGWRRDPELWRDRAVLYALMTTGFAEISFEVIIILGFQILFGYLYYQIGLILASFMLGLAAGSFHATKRLPHFGNPYGAIKLTQLIDCLYPLLLMGIFKLLSGHQASGIIQAGFPFLTAIAGLVGGFQFPLATKVYLDRAKGVGKTIGITYGMDLAGACLGALLVSTLLLPLIGIYQTCLLLCLLNLSALTVLLVR